MRTTAEEANRSTARSLRSSLTRLLPRSRVRARHLAMPISPLSELPGGPTSRAFVLSFVALIRRAFLAVKPGRPKPPVLA